MCLDPGLNQGPSDLQSDALPTELSRLAMICIFKCLYKSTDYCSQVNRITVFLCVSITIVMFESVYANEFNSAVKTFKLAFNAWLFS